jgi:RimJ/RimL family protein N-acetyltransferase
MFNTERLNINPIEIADAEAVFAYRSDAETNKYQGWVPNELEQIEDFIETKVSHEMNVSGTWVQWALKRNDTNELIGDVGVHFLSDDDMQCEVGCTLAKMHHGKGYATEALHAVITYLFKELDKHRIVTSIDPANISSIKLVERLGFRKEAHHIESLYLNGQWVDDVIYAVLKREWK